MHVSHIPQVSLLTESGGTKDDLRLPSDEALLTQVSDLVLSCSFGIHIFFPELLKLFFFLLLL